VGIILILACVVYFAHRHYQNERKREREQEILNKRIIVCKSCGWRATFGGFVDYDSNVCPRCHSDLVYIENTNTRIIKYEDD